MKFEISRTSWSGNTAPCDGAQLEPYVRIDERTVDSPAKIGSHGEPTWYELGRNHRVENGHIMRDFDDTAWFIEMNSLDDLIAFHKAHGDLVISDGFTRITRIEIYDDYRE